VLSLSHSKGVYILFQCGELNSGLILLISFQRLIWVYKMESARITNAYLAALPGCSVPFWRMKEKNQERLERMDDSTLPLLSLSLSLSLSYSVPLSLSLALSRHPFCDSLIEESATSHFERHLKLTGRFRHSSDCHTRQTQTQFCSSEAEWPFWNTCRYLNLSRILNGTSCGTLDTLFNLNGYPTIQRIPLLLKVIIMIYFWLFFLILFFSYYFSSSKIPSLRMPVG
jgi:hypothetical protein